MNYAALVTAVQDFLECTFEASVIDICIRQAEDKIYNAVQIPSLRKNVSGTTTLGLQFLACPSDYLSAYSMAVVDPITGNYTFLLNKDVNFIREAYPNPTTVGLPKYYALFGPQSATPTQLSFILGPTPDLAYAAYLHYNAYPESIVDAGTSWLGDNYDPALLYGTIVEAYTFNKGEADLLQLYIAKFNETILQLKRLGDGLERQDAYRSGQVRVTVT